MSERAIGERSRRADARARSVFGWIVGHPWVVVVAVSIATLSAGLELRNLRLDPDVDSYVPLHHPSRMFWHEAEERFMLGNEVLAAVVADRDGTIFTPELLGVVERLTDAVEKLPFVYESELSSLSRAEAIVGTDDSLVTRLFFETAPTSAEEADAIRRAVHDNPVYLDRLVSRDDSIAAVVFKIDRDATDLSEAYARIQAVADEIVVPGARILITGKPMIEAFYGRQMAADLGRLIPLTLFCVLLLLFACFPTLSMATVARRALAGTAIVLGLKAAFATAPAAAAVAAAGSVSTYAMGLALALLTAPGVLAPSAVVTLSLVWTWGLQGALGEPIYIAAIIMPPILIAIGCADGIHIVERYRGCAEDASSPTEALIDAMTAIWRPVVLTSFTTAAGFAALATGDMTAYRSLGLFTGFGVLSAMVLSVTLIPALLALRPIERAESRGARGRAVGNALARLARIIGHRPRVTAWSGAVVSAVLFAGALQLVVDSSWVSSLAPGTPVRVADEELRTRHGGTTPLNIIVDTGVTDGIKNPEVLRAMDRVLAEISTHAYVGDTRSIAEYIKRMHQALNGDAEAAYRIPDDPQMVAQVLLLHSMSGDPGEMDDTVDYDYREANMSINMRTDRLKAMEEIIVATEALVDEHLRPLGVTATLTGPGQMQNLVAGLVFQGQVYSLIAASTFIFILLMLLYRSPSYVAVCMVPPAFSGLATFGWMGALGITLGPSEAVIAAIALGIGIDYSIHLISRVRAEVAAGRTTTDAVVEALRTTGRGIVFNAVVVCVGFSVLVFSESPSNVAFGLLIAGNMATCCVAALTFVPALLALLEERATEVEAAAPHEHVRVAPEHPAV